MFVLQAIPGVLEYEGARIQLLDLPGIVEGAAMGRGRGRQVVSVAKTADVIIIMSKHTRLERRAERSHSRPRFTPVYCPTVDATKSHEQRKLLEAELDAVGIRLNTSAPDGGYTIDSKRDLYTSR